MATGFFELEEAVSESTNCQRTNGLKTPCKGGGGEGIVSCSCAQCAQRGPCQLYRLPCTYYSLGITCRVQKAGHSINFYADIQPHTDLSTPYAACLVAVDTSYFVKDISSVSVNMSKPLIHALTDNGSVDDWAVVTLLQGVCFKGLQRYDEAEASFKSILKQ